MKTSRETWLIYNGVSGSHDDDALKALVAALAAAGHEPARVIDCHEAGAPDACAASSAGLGTIVIHGGDGTISRTIAGLENFGGAVLPLPGGTFNLLAHEIFGERDPLEIVAMLGEGRLGTINRNCIRGDKDVLALCELLAGPGAKWADVREELRDLNVGEAISKGWDAATMSSVGPMVRVTDPVCGREDGYAGLRLCPMKRGIAIQGYGTEGLGDYLQQGFAILKRDFREGPHDDLGEASALTCSSTEGEPIPLMVDGERCEGASDMRFSLAPLEVDLLGPVDGR